MMDDGWQNPHSCQVSSYKIGDGALTARGKMTKVWRIAILLLVGLAGCSDKKAEQATALKQEIQDLLAKTAGDGSRKFITYGEVTVTPSDDAFAVAIDKFAVTFPDSKPIDLGKIGFKLTPEGDDIRKFSDISLPQSIVFKGNDGKEEAEATLTVDHASGSWSKKMGQLLDADILLKDFELTQPSTPDKLSATEVSYQLQSKDNGQGAFDQQASLGSKLITISDKNGQVQISDFKGSSNLGSAKLAELMALRAEWQKLAEAHKSGEMLPLAMKTFQLFKTMKISLALGQSTVSAGGTKLFSIGAFGLDFGMQDVDQPKVNISSNLRYATLSIPQLKDLVGGLGAEILPTDFNMTLSVAELPLSAILTSWAKTLPEAKVADENAVMSAGMAAAGMAVQAIQQAAVKLGISDGQLKAPGLSGKFTGDLNNDPRAAMGFTGSANVELSDLDAVIANGQQYANEPTTPEILGVLQVMRSMSEHGTDGSGKPVDRFKISMDATGTALVNGKPLRPMETPTAEQPSTTQPSNGDQPSGN
jgi:hypothetical protein